MVWSQIDVTKAHVAYAVIAVFSACFSLCSLFVKEKLYLGEASVATIYGLIVGPHCLNWFNPLSWGNYFYITLELSRVLLCIEIVAVSVELPKKYVLKHWFSLFLLLIPCMTAGWLIIGAFIYAIIPGLTFSHGLLISACVTATDPILAQAVVGKGKFAKRVPAHLRNLLSAESACNDGVSVPFVYLALNLILHSGHASEIAKDWICVTVLYECVFGCVLGSTIGYVGRKALRYAEDHDLIDHESFLAFYIMLALLCAGFGSILGIDDLLASFCAGTAFAWDGWFTHRTEESNVSTVIDILLNMAYFVYFGSIIPWQEFNDTVLGLNCWRLICLALVVLTLRRIPAVLLTKAINPDLKNWKEAIFVGHFGPIGVGAVFAAIIAISDLEADVLNITHGPSTNYPVESEYYQLIRIIWPTVCFLIITSIIVHGSSVAVLTLGKQLQSMTFTMTWTKGETDDINGSGNGNGNWFNRLPKIERSGTSFSLKRIDTMANHDYADMTLSSNTSMDEDHLPDEKINARLNANIGMDRLHSLSNQPTIETSGIRVRPSGGANRKKKKKLLKRKQSKKRKTPPTAQTLDLKEINRHPTNNSANINEKDHDDTNEHLHDDDINKVDEHVEGIDLDRDGKLVVPLQRIVSNASRHSENSLTSNDVRLKVHAKAKVLEKIKTNFDLCDEDLQPRYDEDGELRIPTQAINYDNSLVIEDQHGEVLHTVRSRASTSASQKSQDSKESKVSTRSRANTVSQKILSTIGGIPNAILPNKEKEDDGEEESEHNISEILEKKENDEGQTNNTTTTRSRKNTNKSTYDKFIDLSDMMLFKNDVPRRTRKLHGYRVNDDIIIENEDGEILGRYKVNIKKQKAEELSKGISDEQYNANLINKTLRYFGLKKERETIDEELNEYGNDDLIPENDEVVELGIEDKIKHFINANPKKAIVELPIAPRRMTLKRRISSKFNNTKSKVKERTKSSSKSQSKSTSKSRSQHPSITIDNDHESFDSDDSEYDDDDENENDNGDDSDDDYTLDDRGNVVLRDSDNNNLIHGETEIERARRIAALDKSKRYSDDEEEV